MTESSAVPEGARRVANAHRVRQKRCAGMAAMLGFLVLAANPLHAQSDEGGLTLAQARALARRASPDVATARAAIEAAAGRETQAGAFPNPVLSYNREQTSRGNVTTAQDIAFVEQRIEIGGQASQRVASARLRRQAAEAALAAAEVSVDVEVARAFAAALAGDRRAALAQAAAGRFADATRVMGERLAAGDVSGYAARRVRLEAARYAALAAEAQLESSAARLGLAVLVGVPADTTLAQVDRSADLAAILEMPPDSIEALVLRNHAGLQEARLAADAGRADAQLARRERVPTPIASAGFKRERAPGGNGSLSGFVAGLSLPLPIWDRRAGSIEAAEAQARVLASQAEAIRQRVVRDARTAVESARQTEIRIAALEAQLGEEAEAALRAADAAFDEGEITLVEWLDAVRAYHEAETAYASVIAESIIQRATLERLLGVTLIR